MAIFLKKTTNYLLFENTTKHNKTKQNKTKKQNGEVLSSVGEKKKKNSKN